MITRSAWIGVFGVVSSVLLPGLVWAFGFNADPTRWKRQDRQPILFTINIAEVPVTLTREQYTTTLRKAIEPWTQLETADLPFSLGQVVDEPDKTRPIQDGLNMIFWKPDFVSRDQFAGKAFSFPTECDIVISPRAPFTLLDVQAVVMHELGHCMGLAHSTALSVMTKFAGLPSLGYDDQVAVSLRYPHPAHALPRTTATVTGRVPRKGKPLLWAVVRLVDATTSRIVLAGFSGLVDGQRKADTGGRFELPGIRPGHYHLRVEPMDAFAAADPRGYGAPVSTPPTPFQPLTVELPELEASDTHDVGTLAIRD